MLLCSLFAKKFQYLTPNQQLQTIHIHHNGKGHFVTSWYLTNKVKLYDSLNTKPATELLKQITGTYFCDFTTPEILHVILPACQGGSVDCGLFGVAYATDIEIDNHPAEVIYDEMRYI